MNGVKKRVLVTGATGFLGRHVVTELARLPDVEVVLACRDPSRLSKATGEIRPGDLLSPEYRRSVVQGIDVLCHVGTWGAFYGHAKAELEQFFEPAVDLLEQFAMQGGRRFILASTVAVAAPASTASVDDFAQPVTTGYWPHLDRLIEFDQLMRQRATEHCEMVTLRLGHFVGAGNRFGLVPALVPRLKTGLVPWLDGGKARLPLASAGDLGQAFALAATVEGLRPYESFNIGGPESPTAKQVIEHIAQRTQMRPPWFSVPYWAGHAFGWLMETCHPLLPGKAPFLTRSLVHVAQDFPVDNSYAAKKLGYCPRVPWRTAVDATLEELRGIGFPWLALAQTVSQLPVAGTSSSDGWPVLTASAKGEP